MSRCVQQKIFCRMAGLVPGADLPGEITVRLRRMGGYT